MKQIFNFLLYPATEASRYEMDMLPVNSASYKERSGNYVMTGSRFLLNLNGPIQRMYGLDQQNNPNPLSEMVFYLMTGNNELYGQTLYGGECVHGVIEGDLQSRKEDYIAELDLTIVKQPFDSINILRCPAMGNQTLWETALRYKSLALEGNSLNNNYKIYTKAVK